MNIDAEMRRKIAVSVGASLLFVASLILVGLQFTQPGPDGEGVVLTSAGGTVFVGAIAAFVLLMAAIGIYLDRS